MSNSFVIAGGWSLGQDVDRADSLLSLGHVIGVNDVGIHLPTHEVVTMDRLWFEHRWPALRVTRPHPTVWVREKCDCNVPRKDVFDDWKTFKHFNKIFPSVTAGELHGGNSGTCAINLAFQRMTEGDNLFLLGFDMCKGPHGEPYWYPPYSWARPDGATKAGHFASWVRDISGFASHSRTHNLNVYNVSMRSQLQCWPKLKFDQMMEMIT